MKGDIMTRLLRLVKEAQIPLDLAEALRAVVVSAVSHQGVNRHTGYRAR